MALAFTDNDDGDATLKVGMVPSASGADLVPLDEDMDGVFKVSDKDTQVFRTLATDGHANSKVTDYDLSGLTLED